MLGLGDEARPEPRMTLMASTGSAHTRGRDWRPVGGGRCQSLDGHFPRQLRS